MILAIVVLTLSIVAFGLLLWCAGSDDSWMIVVGGLCMTRREEIEQQASLTVFPWDDVREQSKFEEGFIEGAKWVDKTMIDKTYKWILCNMPKYVKANQLDVFINNEDMASDFRKAMEE